MNADRMKKLLQQAVPPMDAEAGPGRDLWPAILRRLNGSPKKIFAHSSVQTYPSETTGNSSDNWPLRKAIR